MSRYDHFLNEMSNSSILHIFDDEIISRSTIELLSKLNYQQTFCVISNTPEKWMDLSLNSSELILIPISEHLQEHLAVEIQKCDIVFLQAFSLDKAKAILSKKFNDKVFIWALWGYALYNIVHHFDKTTDASITTKVKEKGIVSKLKDIYTFRFIYKRAVKKLDICLFLLESDYQMLSGVINNKAEWMTACYQTRNNLFNGKEPTKINGNSILIGNSSTPSNRHNLIFDHLKNTDLQGREVIVPLSYGDDSTRKEVLAIGKELFDENFHPIVDFVPLEQYMQQLQGCSHVIMGHKRQQAFGSILMMLIAGSKVFLSNESPFLEWFRNLGVTIFELEKDISSEIQAALPETDQRRNKTILMDYLSEKNVLERLDKVMLRAKELHAKKSMQ